MEGCFVVEEGLEDARPIRRRRSQPETKSMEVVDLHTRACLSPKYKGDYEKREGPEQIEGFQARGQGGEALGLFVKKGAAEPPLKVM